MALNSKRMQTFFNEFLISTSTFLNQFMTDCENKFFEFERKLNRIESNLVIIEAKLASVPLESDTSEPPAPAIPVPPPIPTDPPQQLGTQNQSEPQTEPKQPEEAQIPQPEPPQNENKNLIKISESFLYKKYFKMLKFGVPEPAVRVKMLSEHLDANLIADPNLLIDRCPEDDEVVEE